MEDRPEDQNDPHQESSTRLRREDSGSEQSSESEEDSGSIRVPSPTGSVTERLQQNILQDLQRHGSQAQPIKLESETGTLHQKGSYKLDSLPKKGRDALSNDETQPIDPVAPIEWDDFEARCRAELGAKRQAEAKLSKKLDRLLKVYHIWSNAGAVQEEQRAMKRLKTRITYVQNAEDELRSRQEHRKLPHIILPVLMERLARSGLSIDVDLMLSIYDKVMSAFNQAMSILRDSS